MAEVRYKDGRLYITNRDPWGEFKSIEFNPRDLDYKYKSELIRAVDEMMEKP